MAYDWQPIDSKVEPYDDDFKYIYYVYDVNDVLMMIF